MSENKLLQEFVPYEQSLVLRELGFDEPCFFAFDNCSTPMRCSDLRTNEQKFNGVNYNSSSYTSQPTFSQAINFLYICSNKQIDIELKASDTYEKRLRKIDQGCEDLWNLQNSKSN